jgi:hypothetical protein
MSYGEYESVHVSNAEALLHACPQCEQPAGSMCVYMPVRIADPRSTSKAVQAKLRRVGTPTNRAHNERRQTAYTFRKIERRKKLEAERDARVRNRKPTVYESMAKWYVQENARLRDWIQQWGSVLWPK